MEGFELKLPHFAHFVSGCCRTLQRGHPLCRVSSHGRGDAFSVPRFVSRQMVRFTRLRLFNALLGWGECELPVESILP